MPCPVARNGSSLPPLCGRLPQLISRAFPAPATTISPFSSNNPILPYTIRCPIHTATTLPMPSPNSCARIRIAGHEMRKFVLTTLPSGHLHKPLERLTSIAPHSWPEVFGSRGLTRHWCNIVVAQLLNWEVYL
ncbi:hypothetical protein GJ744_007746 [Endocarpon pusillum]|uniref:Uncharacterized protein n=1 Tax=Endocarpon pusillum TaxID=364733 RepID=A0A8H7AYX8_9EURO|nr:hypothetical protein GJ744_007746 [Endocarpon pusillum]